MRKILLLLITVLSLNFSLALAEIPKVEAINVEGLEILYIQDAPCFMPKSLFLPLSDEEWNSVSSEDSLIASMNVFAFKNNDNWVLVDTGNGQKVGKLAEYLKIYGIDPKNIQDILITHLHGDHYNGLFALDESSYFPNATIHVNQQEFAYWQHDKSSQKVIELIQKQVKFFNYGDQVIAGVTALDIHGHTPGHSAFMLATKQDPIVFVGDILHALDLQLPYPHVNMAFDLDKEQAASTRKLFFQEAVENNYYLLGTHFPFPQIIQLEQGKDKFEIKKTLE